MISTDFLRQLDRFSLVVKKRITSSFVGPQKSQAYGRGLVFKDYKDYVPGDDFRAIDWKIYARTERLNIKRFEEERNMTLRILLDASGSMNFGERTKKYEYGAMIGIGFAYMAYKNNERYTFSTFAEGIQPLRARKGGGQLLEMVHRLNTVEPRGLSRFKNCLDEYKRFIDSKSIIILISDCLFDLEPVKEVLLRYKRSDVIVIQVLDPVEKNLTYTGDMILKDAETNTSMRTFVSQRLKRQYQEQLAAHITRLKDICSRTNTEYQLAITDTPIFETFYQILR